MTETSNNNGFKQVYKSTAKVPCEPWFAPADAEIAYPFVKEAPNAKLKSPKYDWINYRWYETDGAVQGQQLAEIAKQVRQLNDDVANDKLSNKAINQQLGTLVELVSADAIAQQASTDNKADNKPTSNGGTK